MVKGGTGICLRLGVHKERAVAGPRVGRWETTHWISLVESVPVGAGNEEEERHNSTCEI